MPSLKDIKSRIHSVKSTQKITKAMKMISTARLNKARVNLTNASTYYEAMQNFVLSLSSSITDFTESTPLIKNFFQGSGKKTLHILLSTDKGLCGALNTYLFKEIPQINEQNILLPIGKKAFEYTNKRYKVETQAPLLTSKPESLQNITKCVTKIVEDESIGSINIIYPEFHSAILQKPVVKGLLQQKTKESTQFTVEGSALQTLQHSMVEFIKAFIANALAQLVCSEHAARMMAMENATNNANTRIKDLTLVYNKTRQANITREILEIVAGSQSV